MTLSYLLDWLNFLGRAVHVIAGIAWIGASFYFIWLDNHLQPAADPSAANRGVSGELWAVHGGGFYHAQKYGGAPPRIPERLHWFKWEAYTTLLSGLFLLAVLYYAQADVYLVGPGASKLSAPLAIATGIGWIVAGWVAYDSLCKLLGHHDRALAAVLAVLLAGAAYALCQMFPGRAAYLHFGAMLGTIMVLNVFFVIIPGQRAMVRAAAEGRPVDPAWGRNGKQRSVHNTYFTLPVVFTMLSNHYAWIFGSAWNWLWLVVISAAGALVRAWFVARHRGAAPAWMMIVAVVLVLAATYGLRPERAATAAAPTDARAQSIAVARCAGCHAARPSMMAVAPKAIALESVEQLRLHAPRVREQLGARAMPPGNVTAMTETERAELMAWIDSVGKR